MYQLIDFTTRKKVSPKNLVFTGKNGPWEVVVDMDRVKARINIDYFKKEPAYNSKYLPFMPIEDYSTFMSLSEGATPLIKSRFYSEKYHCNLYFKYEGQNPTGSFKDRGSAVEITMARQLNAKAIVVASTGNMAASVSCYAAYAKIPCFIFVPEGTPPSKLAQVISYNGKIVQVKGTYNDAAALAQQVAEKLGFYLAGDYAFRVEGQKTTAFEIIDQLFFKPPDILLAPMGCGTNISSFGKGLREYQALGFIDKLPQLVGTQAKGACSIVNSFNKKKMTIDALPKIDTIASAIAVSYPLDGVKALAEIAATGGHAFAVSDKEILETQYTLAKEEGLFVEASCAAPIASLSQLNKQTPIKGKTLVCVITGSGLKDPSTILKIATKPPTIHPEVEEFLSLYKSSYFEGKTVSFVEKDTVLFDKRTDETNIKRYALQYFETKLTDVYAKKISNKVTEFLKKGKKVTLSDFQDIIQDVLETPNGHAKKLFAVVDFVVQTAKDKAPSATVVVKVNGQRREARANGVGPVDAVINALRKASGDKVPFALTDYHVEIRSRGTDAVVFVEMQLKRNGTTSVGQGTSPDIIQASIEAFEDAYNELGTNHKTSSLNIHKLKIKNKAN